MANKIIQTRIKNRIDTLANWEKAGVELLKGEIALVQVPTGDTYVNPVTGKSEPVIELLMKVGEEGKTFSQLPWLSARAADVYDWAKKQTAAEVPISVGDKSTTLGGLFTAVNSNDADIAAIQEAIDALNGTGAGTGSIADRITAAINALDHTDVSKTSNTIVKTVTQTDGKVTVTYGSITEAELPSISSDKIKVDASTTLSTKLEELDAAIAAIPEGFSVTPSGSGVVKSITYDNAGKFTVTKAQVATAEIADANVTTAKIADSNVTTAKIANEAVTSEKIKSVDASKVLVATNKTLPTRLTELASEISSINTAIAGGVHFIGITTTNISEGSTTGSVTVGGKTHTAALGDVVIKDNREFIWDGSKWYELGDLSRVGTLETWRGGLNEATTNTVSSTHKFASQVTQSDGKIAVIYTQPDAVDVSYTPTSGTKTTVNAALNDHAASISNIDTKLEGVTKVTTSIENAINALDVNEPTASGTSTSFIKTAKQENGKIVVTKANLPTASTSTAGIVQLSSSTSISDENLAATPKAVKAAYDLADTAKSDAAAVAERATAIESNYIQAKKSTVNGQDTYTAMVGTYWEYWFRDRSLPAPKER